MQHFKESDKKVVALFENALMFSCHGIVPTTFACVVDGDFFIDHELKDMCGGSYDLHFDTKEQTPLGVTSFVLDKTVLHECNADLLSRMLCDNRGCDKLWRVDDDTVEQMKCVRDETSKQLAEVENEIRLLMEKHTKITSFCNQSINAMLHAKGEKLEMSPEECAEIYKREDDIDVNELKDFL